MAFIVALLGGLYLLCRYAGDKAETKAIRTNYEREWAEHRACIELFESKVIDKELEADLEDFIYKPENQDKVWEEVSKAYDEMPWKPEEEKFICLDYLAAEKKFGRSYTAKELAEFISFYRQEALRIMLANRGKISQYDRNGFTIDKPRYTPTQRGREKATAESAGLVLWMQEKLKEHGVNEAVYIHHHSGYFFPLCDKTKTYGGEYTWAPYLTPLEEQTKIRDTLASLTQNG